MVNIIYIYYILMCLYTFFYFYVVSASTIPMFVRLRYHLSVKVHFNVLYLNYLFCIYNFNCLMMVLPKAKTCSKQWKVIKKNVVIDGLYFLFAVYVLQQDVIDKDTIKYLSEKNLSNKSCRLKLYIYVIYSTFLL